MLHSIHPLLVSLFCNLWSLCVVIVLLHSSPRVVTAIKDRLTVATSASVDGTLLPLISEAAMEEEGRSGAANLSLSVSWDCKNEKEAARKHVQRPPKKRLADICLVPVSGEKCDSCCKLPQTFLATHLLSLSPCVCVCCSSLLSLLRLNVLFFTLLKIWTKNCSSHILK